MLVFGFIRSETLEEKPIDSESDLDTLKSGSVSASLPPMILTSNQSNILKLEFMSSKGEEVNQNFHYERGYYELEITKIQDITGIPNSETGSLIFLDFDDIDVDFLEVIF